MIRLWLCLVAAAEVYMEQVYLAEKKTKKRTYIAIFWNTDIEYETNLKKNTNTDPSLVSSSYVGVKFHGCLFAQFVHVF